MAISWPSIATKTFLLFSHWVVSDSLWSRRLQHARLPCPSLSPGVCSHLSPLTWWCHPTISSFVAPFSSCPQSIFSNELAGCFRWPKYWNLSFNISPSNELSGLISFRVDWLISFQSKGFSSLLQHHSLKASIFWCSAFLMVQLLHLYMTTG